MDALLLLDGNWGRITRRVYHAVAVQKWPHHLKTSVTHCSRTPGVTWFNNRAFVCSINRGISHCWNFFCPVFRGQHLTRPNLLSILSQICFSLTFIQDALCIFYITRGYIEVKKFLEIIIGIVIGIPLGVMEPFNCLSSPVMMKGSSKASDRKRCGESIQILLELLLFSLVYASIQAYIIYL